jgi:hypothetical protein
MKHNAYKARLDALEVALAPKGRQFVCTYFESKHAETFEEFVAASLQEHGVTPHDDLVTVHVSFS